MTLRPYKEEDAGPLAEMLSKEGITSDRMAYKLEDFHTFVATNDGKIVGFFTLKKIRDVYLLQHFCLDRDHRGYRNFSALNKFLEAVLILQFRKRHFIISIGSERDRIKKLIRHRYRTNPYEEKDGQSNYFVKIHGG